MIMYMIEIYNICPHHFGHQTTRRECKRCNNTRLTYIPRRATHLYNNKNTQYTQALTRKIKAGISKNVCDGVMVMGWLYLHMTIHDDDCLIHCVHIKWEQVDLLGFDGNALNTL